MTTPGLDTLEDDEKQAGAAVKATAKGLSPVGTIAMDPTQTEALLANMQDMVDQRTGAFNTFMSGLQRASAWGSGGERGPAAALTAMDQQKLAEDKELFNMRQQMAALRSSAAQQKAFNERKQAELSGGAGGAGAAPSGAGGTRSVFDQMPAEIKRALSNARTQEEWNSIYNPYAQKIAQSQAQFKYNPATYETKIRFVDPITKELDYIDAETAKRYKEMGYGANIIMPTQPAKAKPTGGISPEAIEKVESGGKPGLVSPKGAEGVMQVMPMTQTDPGFGVTPAKDKSPEELRRVGRDYYSAMQNRYGDDNLAAIAYNMGPGKTDAWLAKGGEFNDLPKETQDYIGRVNLANAKLNRAQAQVAVPQAAGAPRKTIPQAEVELKGDEAKAVAAGAASGKYIGGKEAEIIEAGSNSGNRLASITNIEKYISDPRTSRVFGVFEKPGFWNGFGAIIQSGVKVGSLGEVGLKDLDKLVTSNMKNATQAEKDAAQIVTREFAQMKLQEAKVLLAGQGAVSDAERGLIAELTGSRLNSAGAIKEYLTWGRMRAEYDYKVGDAYGKWKEANPRGNFDQFRVTPQARGLREEYNNRMMDFAKSVNIDMGKAKNTGAKLNEQDRSGNTVAMGGGDAAKPATTSPYVYKDADKEKRYQLYLQQQGKQ